MVGNMKKSKNVLHEERYVLSVKTLIIIQECVRSKGVHDLQQEVNEPELEDNDFFMGAINHEGGDELLVNLVIEDSHTVKVKSDTGVQVNVMALALHKALGKDPKKSQVQV